MPASPRGLIHAGREAVFSELQRWALDTSCTDEVKHLCHGLQIPLCVKLQGRRRSHEDLCAALLEKVPNARVHLEAIAEDGLPQATKRLRCATRSVGRPVRQHPMLVETCPGLLVDFATALGVPVTKGNAKGTCYKAADELRKDILQRLDLLCAFQKTFQQTVSSNWGRERL